MAKIENLTDEARARFFKALKLGHSRRTSAEYARISPQAVSEWIRLGKDGPTTIHGEFLTDVLSAEADPKFDCLKSIQEAARDAQRVADTLNVNVAFMFNYQRCVAVPGGTSVALADQFLAGHNPAISRVANSPRT